jgi:ornithine carbamoyltransferase
MINLKDRSLLDLKDLASEEITFLLQLAQQLKTAKRAAEEQQYLRGKNIALIFEKDSTRTRCAFEVAAYDQGAHITYISATGSHMGTKESVKDTARVLGRMYDAIEYRGDNQKVIEEMAAYAGVPVWNGLTHESHPTQVLADLMTIQEFSTQPLSTISLCYSGDGRNNIALSLLLGSAKMGMDFRIASPVQLQPSADFLQCCQTIANQTGARLLITSDSQLALKGADFLYTDVWVSMGETIDWTERIAQLKPYQINRAALDLTGNPEVKFMHCLPALHNCDTELGEKLYKECGLKELEVTDEVFESSHSIVFDQAENRLHTIKALMVATLS